MASRHTRRRFLASNVVPIPPGGTEVAPNLFPQSLVGAGTKGNPSGDFVPVNPNATEQLAVSTDEKGYNIADQDFAKRFPLLAQGRDLNIASAQQNLAGGSDALMNSTLNQSGLGDVNLGQGEYAQARNIGVPIAAKESRDRAYFQRLLADNPHRAFGLNGQDIARIALANTNGVNVNKQGQFGSRLNQYVASVQQSGQNQAALIGGVGSLAGAAISNPYLTSGGYGAGPGSGSVGAYNAAASQAPGGAVGYNTGGQAGYWSAGQNPQFTPADSSTGGGVS